MTTGKKTHWLRTTLIVLIACGIAGLALAAVQFHMYPDRAYASATLLFSFEGAAEGKAPNGYPFDVSGITSDEVLEAALEASGLTGVYTPEQVRKNLKVTGVYPENITQQMTNYVSMLDTNADMQATVKDYHATQYSVTLYADLDPSLPSGQLTELLGNILSAYRTYFGKIYAAGMNNEDAIANLSDYDYPFQVEAIGEKTAQQSRHAQEMTELAPDFQFNGKTFGDIVLRYGSLETETEQVSAEIILNAVSKDPERLKDKYEMEISSSNHQMESKQAELKEIEKMMDAYEKEGIIYVSTGNSLRTVDSNANSTYEELVERRRKLTEEIASLNAKIAANKARLEDLTGGAGEAQAEGTEETEAAVKTASDPEEAKASAERRIQRLRTKQEAIAKDFMEMLEAYSAGKINEKTVAASEFRYKAPSLLSGAFLVRAVKTAGPICAVGFMVCLVLMIISRRKEEKASRA